MKQRLNWVDAIKGFGVILVIVGHSSCPAWLLYWIYIFHIPLFFMLSGLMFKDSEKSMSLGRWIKYKSRNLLWPYLIFGILELLFDGAIGLVSHDIARENVVKKVIALIYSNYLFEYNYTGVIWFLTCLFTTELLFFILQKFIRNKVLRTIIILSLGVLGLRWNSITTFLPPFFADKALTAILFYSLGYLLRNIFEKEGSRKEEIIGFLAVVIGSILGLYMVLCQVLVQIKMRNLPLFQLAISTSPVFS